MRYTITGATGCLGMNLTKRLVHEGHEVIALGRNEFLGRLISTLGAQFIPLDLHDSAGLKTVCRASDAVFHCAALSSPWGRYRDFYQSNVVGTQHVIDAMPEEARLIHVSSPSIYFNFAEQHQIKEEALKPPPRNHYIKSKLHAELLIDKACKERNLNVVTIRPRAIFGPFDRAIVPRILDSEKKGILPIIGTGTNIIDVTYVDNVVDSLILAATAGEKVRGKKYNITNDEPKSVLAIIELLYGALNKTLKTKNIPYAIARRLAWLLETIHQLPFLGEPRLTQYSCAVLALGQTLNIDAAKKDLKYTPKVSIEQGMHHAAEWYKSL